MKKIIYLILFFNLAVYAGDHLAFKTIDNSHLYTDTKLQNTIDLGRTRSQDGVSVCYALTIAKRLEHLCKQTVSCDLDGKEVSTLHLQSLNDGGIEHYADGGSDYTFLKKIGHSPNKRHSFVQESCAPFDQTLVRSNEIFGIEELKKIYDKALECVSCEHDMLAKEISSKLPKLKRETSEILNLLKNLRDKDFKTFANDILIQNNCYSTSNKIEIPRFRYRDLSHSELENQAGVMKNIFMLIDKNIPPQLNICTSDLEKGKRECGRHGIIVTGYRKRCAKNGACKFEVRVQNSWGQSWQTQFNNGWVDAEMLTKHVFGYYEEKNGRRTFIKDEVNYSDKMTWFEPLETAYLSNPRDRDTGTSTKVDFKKQESHRTLTLINDKAKNEVKDDDEEEKTRPLWFACTKPGEQFQGTDNLGDVSRFKADGYTCRQL